MFRFTKHAAQRQNSRSLNALDAAVQLEQVMKDKFGLSTLPDGEYVEGETRLVVQNGRIVTVTEAHHRGHYRVN